MLARRALFSLAALITAVALLVLLYQQFARERAAWPALVLSGALLVWWFTGQWPGRDAAVAAWAARGLLLAAAAAYYGMVGPDRPRLDPVMAAFAAGLITAGVLQRPDRGFPRGRRLDVHDIQPRQVGIHDLDDPRGRPLARAGLPLPPAYLPIWLNRLVRAGSSRSGGPTPGAGARRPSASSAG
jgi:hypothetical protein